MTQSGRKCDAQRLARVLDFHRRNLNTPGEAGRKALDVERAEQFCSNESEQVDRLCEECLTEYGEQFARRHDEAAPKQPQPSCPEVRTYACGRFLFLVVELVLGTLVGIHIFNLPAPLAATVGIGITLTLYYGTRSVLKLRLVDNDDQPRANFQLLQKIIIPLFAVWLIAVMVLLFTARVATAEAMLIDLLFAVLLTILTLVSPAQRRFNTW